MPWPHYCHSALDAESRFFFFPGSPLPRGRRLDSRLRGNDALGKLCRMRTHLLCQLIYVTHYILIIKLYFKLARYSTEFFKKNYGKFFQFEQDRFPTIPIG
jgi:hypothetical protein